MANRRKIAKVDNFNKYYDALPEHIKKKFEKQVRFLMDNPKHPSLKIHRFESIKGLWEFYIDNDYRCLFSIDGDTYILKWVGTHSKMNRKKK